MIEILDDTDVEMMSIRKDGVTIFEGNYWDFDSTPDGLLDLLERVGVQVSGYDATYNIESARWLENMEADE